jgi:nucleotide-binding universal stress UspA family protein
VDEQRAAPPAVVVGVDGSGIALRAVRWATQEAQRRGAPLRIVHVAAPADRGAAAAVRRAGSIVDLARTTAEQTSNDVEVSSACVSGHAAPALADAAADAQLLVVAMGGGERYEDIHLHSTTLSVCTAARCPVAVVRGVAVVPDDGPVVLGVEHVADDAVAVTVAFADAARHGGGLIVVHAVHGTGLLRDHLIGHEAHSRRGAAALTAITDELAPWRSRYPAVPVEIRVVDLPAPGHLLQAAVRARLVVVGTRGRNLAARMVLGSTSHTVLRNAPCPVLVVRRDTQLVESAPFGVERTPGRPVTHIPEQQRRALHPHSRQQRW